VLSACGADAVCRHPDAGRQCRRPAIATHFGAWTRDSSPIADPVGNRTRDHLFLGPAVLSAAGQVPGNRARPVPIYALAWLGTPLFLALDVGAKRLLRRYGRALEAPLPHADCDWLGDSAPHEVTMLCHKRKHGLR